MDLVQAMKYMFDRRKKVSKYNIGGATSRDMQIYKYQILATDITPAFVQYDAAVGSNVEVTVIRLHTGAHSS